MAMSNELAELVYELNPWLKDGEIKAIRDGPFIPRIQSDKLLQPDWDKLWLILIGPRQAGKTTLGKYIAKKIIQAGRFNHFIYLNCDFLLIREWLNSPLFISEAIKKFNLDKPIFFLDEVQRINNPGLLLKGVSDLNYPIKMMASGSSQLEMRSGIQEFLTGRNLEACILPLSFEEMGELSLQQIVYGSYPDVYLAKEKSLVLRQLYNKYIKRDIIEILRIGKPDIMQRLIALLAHSTGQLVNYNQLATDCKVSIPTIQNYCAILEETYIIYRIKPFVGNKRKEIVSNPVYYFIDNGFRNQTLRKLSVDETRSDIGFLVESVVLQEILKYREQHYFDFDIFYWRTQSGAEEDFILYKNEETLIPIEVKYRNFSKPTIPRSLRSFIKAYKPKIAIIATKDFNDEILVDECTVKFISMYSMDEILKNINKTLEL